MNKHRPKVYMESSTISYLTARLSEELIFGFRLKPPLIVTPEQLLYEENLIEFENWS